MRVDFERIDLKRLNRWGILFTFASTTLLYPVYTLHTGKRRVVLYSTC